MGRRIMEAIIEIGARESAKSDVLSWATSFRYNRNRARLSFDAHYYAQVRQALVTIGREEGIDNFMCWPTYHDFDPSGLLSKHAWMVRTFDEWVGVFKDVNRNRKRIVPFPGLGLHHGSNELYVPIPETLLDAARKWGREKRN